MASQDQRQNPDALLASIKREEGRVGQGRLKIFLGMCPGVGKTYAMLEAARAIRRKGGKVVVALVETHGREETKALLEGLELLPRKKVEYRGSIFEEMDLDGALARKTAIILVDEFAHSNPPESRHAKRYQDVMELVDAGATVYTTLNIQHIESRVDVVRQITGIRVQETVPDAVIDGADEVELVDLTPGQLRNRLEEGRVYLGDRAAAAAENFFKEENLIALREIALRYTADKVDQELRQFMNSRRIRSWRTHERLLVAVGPSPYAESLLRWTRRLAGMLDCPWTALYVDTGTSLSEPVRESVTRTLDLARRLGADVETFSGVHVGESILRFAGDNHVTQIVLGKSEEPSWKRWFQLTFAEKLIRASGDIDVLVVRPEKSARPRSSALAKPSIPKIEWGQWLSILGTASVVTLVSWWVEPYAGYFSVALLYLFSVVLASLKLSRWPVLALAFLSALTWDYLFIPPHFTFYIGKTQDMLMFVMLLVVALVTGHMTGRLRLRERLEREREMRTATLLSFTQTLVKTPNLGEALHKAMKMIEELFPVNVGLFKRLTGESLSLVPEAGSTYFPDSKEQSVAAWSYAQIKPAGKFTDTLGHARALYLPLSTQVLCSGVLAIEPRNDWHLDLRDRSLLENFGTQLAFALEKEHVLAAMQQAEISERSSELQKTLLDSVSHELKTPLAVLQSATEILERSQLESLHSLPAEIRMATSRLNRVVDHLLEITRLESGIIQPQPEWFLLSEIASSLQLSFGQMFPEREIKVGSLPDLMVLMDSVLLEKSIWNLLHNAAVYTPESGPVELDFELKEGQLFATVRDHGPGIPEEDRIRIFEKFYRASPAKAGGTGLGLAISKGFVRSMGGTLEVTGALGGGTVFSVRLPAEWRKTDSFPGI